MTKEELIAIIEEKQNLYRDKARQIATDAEKIADINEVLERIREHLNDFEADSVNKDIEEAAKSICDRLDGDSVLPPAIFEDEFDKVIEQLNNISSDLCGYTTIGE